jgi:tetratricopeptide (TPR) repeat protein
LALNPSNIDALTGKGLDLGILGYYTEAIGYFNKALAIDPNNTFALIGKANLLRNYIEFHKASPNPR